MTMAAKNVREGEGEGEGSGTRSCRWVTVVVGLCWVKGVGTANGTENGPLDEREGKDVVGVEGKDVGSSEVEN